MNQPVTASWTTAPHDDVDVHVVLFTCALKNVASDDSAFNVAESEDTARQAIVTPECEHQIRTYVRYAYADPAPDGVFCNQIRCVMQLPPESQNDDVAIATSVDADADPADRTTTGTASSTAAAARNILLRIPSSKISHARPQAGDGTVDYFAAQPCSRHVNI